jgi:hypothetical protein
MHNIMNGCDSTPSMEHSEESQRCRSLWRSMILQAIVDALSRRSRTEHKLARHNAISWLQGDSWGFELICCLAEYNHETVRKRALELINKQGYRLPKQKKEPEPTSAE